MPTSKGPRRRCSSRACISRSKRPASPVFQDRLKRTIAVRQSYTAKRAKARSRSSASSMMVKLSLSQSTAPSSRGSPHVDGFPPCIPRCHSRLFPSIGARIDRDPSAFVPPSPDDGAFPNTQTPTLDSRKHAFDHKLRLAVWLLAEEFSGKYTLLRGFRDAKLDKERIEALTMDALMRRCKSPASTRGVIKNVG